MLTQVADSCLQVTSIGRFAFDLLSSTRQLEVMAAFSKAVFLRASDGEIVWLVEPGSPMHRRAMQTAASLAGLTVGTTLSPFRQHLNPEAGVCLDGSQAVLWDEPALPYHRTSSPVNLVETFRAVLHQLLQTNQPSGFGYLLSAIMEGIPLESSSFLEGKTPSLSRLTLQAVDRIRECLWRQDYVGLPMPTVSLIGLGEGLTPSGDDFLGGLFHSRYILDEIHPDWKVHTRNYSDFIHNSRHLTNEISFTLLQDHALGHTLEPLHLLGSGLLAGQSPEYLLSPARALVDIGHSTGWDLLTGFSVGLLSSCIGEQENKPVERMSHGYQAKD